MRKRADFWDTKELGVFTLFYNNLRFYPTEIFMEGLSAFVFSFFFSFFFFCIKSNRITLWRKYWWHNIIQRLVHNYYALFKPFYVLLSLDIPSIYSDVTYYKYKCFNMALKSPCVCTDVLNSSSRKAISL